MTKTVKKKVKKSKKSKKNVILGRFIISFDSTNKKEINKKLAYFYRHCCKFKRNKLGKNNTKNKNIIQYIENSIFDKDYDIILDYLINLKKTNTCSRELIKIFNKLIKKRDENSSSSVYSNNTTNTTNSL